MRALASALRQTLNLFGSHRKLWVPFLVVAGLEAVLLGLIWLAPHPPFSKLLAPPIRYFFSDRVLHYPAHLWFLYHAMKHVHLVVSMAVGAFMSALACAMVRQAYEGTPLSVRNALISGQVRFGAVLIIWAITWGLAKLLMTALVRFAPSDAGWMMGAAIGLTVALQALLAYAIPATVFAGVKWWKAMIVSVQETVRHPLSTLLVVAVPSAAVIAFSIFVSPVRVAQWMQQTQPEIVFAFITGRLGLWTLVDALMTVLIAHLWWAHRTQPSVQPSRSPFPIPLTSSVASLLVLCALLSSTGCSAAYTGERLFVKATELNAPIVKDPKTATPEQMAKAIQAFEVVTQKARGTIWAARAHTAIGSLYAMQKQYDQARAAYASTLENYNQHRELAFASRLAIAKTYEAQDNWEEAVKVYNDVADFYSWTKTGLEVPLYIGSGYAKRQQPEQAAKAFESAVWRYTNLVPNAPNPEMATTLKGYLALAYQQLGQWDKATAALEELESLSSGVNRPLILLSLGSIYQVKLDDLPKAQAAYTKLITEFPDHPLGKIAKARLEQLTTIAVVQQAPPLLLPAVR